MDLMQLALEMKYKSEKVDYFVNTSKIKVVSLYAGSEIWIPEDIIKMIRLEENEIIAIRIYNNRITIIDAWIAMSAMNDNDEVDYQFLTLHTTDDFSIYLPAQLRSMDCENEALVEVDIMKRQIVITEMIY